MSSMKGAWARFWLSAGIVAVGLGAAGVGRLAWLNLFPDPLGQGHSAYDRGDWRAASKWARQVLRERPGDRGALRLLSRSAARQGRDDLAQAIYGRLGEAEMQGEDYLLLATGFLRQGRAEPALGVLERGRQAEPDHAGILHELARLYARLKRFEEAAEAAERLATLPGWEARGALILGLLRLELTDPDGASEALGRAVRIDPTLRGAPAPPAEVRKVLARSLLQAGRPAEARAQLRVVLAAGRDAEASWLLSRAWLQAGAVDEAEEALASAGADGAGGPPRSEPAPYVGAARCAGCHRAIYQDQTSSRHARTLSRATDLSKLALPDHPLLDPAEAGVTHALWRDGDAIRVATRTDNQAYRAVVEYALGSGDRGLSLVARDDQNRPRVLRMSLYKDRSIWDLTSGVKLHPDDPRELLGRGLNDAALATCLDCHRTSRHAARSPAAPEAADRGIGCERCHGPGGDHLKAVETGFVELAIGRPKLTDAAQITGLCAQCHSPDDPSVGPDDPRFVRFQTRTLIRSRCYLESGGALSCLTCHDAHRDAETSASVYEAKCLDCHATSAPPPRAGRTRPAVLAPGTHRTPCPINPTRDCLKCHMPAVGGAAPHTMFTDHYIRAPR